MEAIIITSEVDTSEDRDVVVEDIPGVYLHVNTDKNILVSFDGTMVELLVKLIQKFTNPILNLAVTAILFCTINSKMTCVGPYVLVCFSEKTSHVIFNVKDSYLIPTMPTLRTNT